MCPKLRKKNVLLLVLPQAKSHLVLTLVIIYQRVVFPYCKLRWTVQLHGTGAQRNHAMYERNIFVLQPFHVADNVGFWMVTREQKSIIRKRIFVVLASEMPSSDIHLLKTVCARNLPVLLKAVAKMPLFSSFIFSATNSCIRNVGESKSPKKKRKWYTKPQDWRRLLGVYIFSPA